MRFVKKLRQRGEHDRTLWVWDRRVFWMSALFVSAFLLLGQVFFETNDDETLNLLAAGAYGPAYHLINQNIVVGRVLAALYRLLPRLNWYLVLMLFFNALSLYLVCLCLGEGLPAGGKLLVTALVQSLAGYQFYNMLQNSKSAALYTAAGALLIARSLPGGEGEAKGGDRPVPWKTGRYLGTGLMVLGFMVRKDSFYSVLPAILVLAAALLLRRVCTVRRLAAGFLPAAVLVIFAGVLHYGAYHLDPDWDYYLKFNKARAELLDYGLPGYKKHREELQALGISRVDLDVLKAWDYMDPETFSLETLEALIRIRGGSRTVRLRMDKGIWLSLWRQIAGAVRAHTLAAGVLAFLLLSLLLMDGIGRGMVLVMALGILAEYWFLVCVGRVVWRGECGIWLAPALLAGGYLARIRQRRQGRARAGEVSGARKRRSPAELAPGLGALLVTGICLAFLGRTFAVEKAGQIDPKSYSYRSLIDAIDQLAAEADAAGESPVYLLDTMSYSYRPAAPSVWSMNGSYRGYYRHVGMLGGWAGASPEGQQYLRARGIDNPLRALIEEKDVYLVDQTHAHALLKKYFAGHYGCRVKVKQVGVADGIPVWRFIQRKH